jgi:putative ABC transport system substrate-binding protein
VVEPFVQGLRDLGYVEGHDIDIDWRFTIANSAARDRELIAAVLRRGVELIVVSSSSSTASAAREMAGMIPILAINVSYPVETGLVGSLARPGSGTLTALTSNAYGVNAKRLQLLRDVVPGLSRVVALVDVNTPAYDTVVWTEFKNAAAQAGLQIERINLRSADDLEAAFASIAASRPDALIDGQSPVLLGRRAPFGELALKQRLPCMMNLPQYVASGALMAYGANIAAISRNAAGYVDKILNGVRPADLPVQQPTRFDLNINATTAGQLAIAIPPDVAAQVTEWVS